MKPMPELSRSCGAPILPRLARLGLVPGQDLDMSKLPSLPNLQDVPKLGVERIAVHCRRGRDLAVLVPRIW
jgi:hypothetical protein